MSSLRGMRHLLRPRRERPPPEEPRLPRVGTEPQLVGLPLDVSVRDLWRSRLHAVMVDNYAGVPLHKMPEDLRVYEHLLWAGCVDTVIALASGAGGSALWFHDRLRSFREQGRSAGAAVISVDLDVSGARANVGERRDIRFVEVDILDPELPARVAAELPRGARCLVVEDGPHTYEATRAALEGFSRFVPAGGWFVAEDGVVDDFELRRDVEAYGLTSNSGGYLRRMG